jgi:hypothetical protein
MQEGKNNEKSREGIGKDKPIRQPAAINDGIIIQDYPVLLEQREPRSFTEALVENYRRKIQVNGLALNTVLNWETTGSGALG